MDAATSAAYAQLLSLGPLWVGLHCAGMCGPLVLGLGLGRTRPGAGPVTQVLAYQLGKALVYALLGALAGAAGQVVAEALARVGPLLAALLGAALLGGTVAHNLRPARGPGLLGPALGRVTGRLGRARLSPLARALALGSLMACLPCMLVGWALALAASTGSAVHGAALMGLLVALNTAPLLASVKLPSLLARRGSRLSALGPWLGALSGTWLLLVAAAAAGWAPHASVGFSALGRGYVVMFW